MHFRTPLGLGESQFLCSFLVLILPIDIHRYFLLFQDKEKNYKVSFTGQPLVPGGDRDVEDRWDDAGRVVR